MSDMITIKKGMMKLVETERSNLISAEQTHDGISFSFKDGFQVYLTDNYLPNHTKDIIKNTIDSFATANLIIDLGNYSKPVLVQPTKK